MPDQNSSNDVDLGVVATGCGTGCGVGCGLTLILLVLAIAMGSAAAQNLGFLQFIGFVGGQVGNLIIGYAVAHKARKARKPVNLHIFVVGGLWMLVGLMCLVIPETGRPQTQYMHGIVGIGSILSFLLMIPVMLVGASWCPSEEPYEHN